MGDRGIALINNIKADTCYAATTYITCMNIMTQPQYFTNKAEHEQHNTLWAADTFYVNGQSPAKDGYAGTNGLHWDSVAGPYHMLENLTVTNKQNYLQFQFAQAHLSRQDTTWYSYLLQGIDKKWRAVTTNTFTENYLNLSPGKYIFKVSSKSISGKWANVAAFNFTITPPWYATWWAYTLFVLLGELRAGIALEIKNTLNFINNFSEVNTELMAEIKKGIDKGNLKDVKTIANDIAANKQKINHHGRRADSIVKDMLLQIRSSNGIKETTDINMLEDEYLRVAYYGLRAKDKSFNAIMNTDFEESIEKVNIVPQDIGRVILNLITNTFYAVNEKKKSPHPLRERMEYEPIVSVSSKAVKLPSAGFGVFNFCRR